MSYEPAFFEVFLGMVVAALWGRWLGERGFPWIGWLTTATSLIASLGLLAAVVLLATAGIGVNADPRLSLARWIPFAVVVATLALEFVLTLRLRIRGG